MKNDIMSEIYKDIAGFEDYQVSNFGNVKSKQKRRKGKSCYYISKEKPIKLNLKKSGYFEVVLTNESLKKTFSVHRLVAIAFIPNPDNKPQVNHINGIKNDNRIENLEWVTASENIIHAVDNGLTNKNRFAKLTAKEVLEIRNLKNKNTEIAKVYNVTRETISLIKNRKTWTHI